MCDYRLESKKAVNRLPVPINQAQKALDPKAYSSLVRKIRNDRIRNGSDLYNGKPLPKKSLDSGHYMTPRNFQRTLSKMNSEPWRCQWCGNKLPQNLVRQHQRPHDHREYIQHHFHPRCWEARLLAVAVIFGHIQPESILHGKKRSQKRKYRLFSVTKITQVIFKKNL